MEIVVHWRQVFVSWCEREPNQICTLLRREKENGEQRRNEYAENRGAPLNLNDGNDAEEHVCATPEINGGKRNAGENADSNGDASGQSVERTAESKDRGNESNAKSMVSRGIANDGNWIEDKIMVNNIVLDDELVGR